MRGKEPGERLSLDGLIGDLKVRYGRFDVFVEGDADRNFVRGLPALQIRGVQVFAISDIEVPSRLLRMEETLECFEAGQKGRLMAVARLVQEAVGDGSAIACVVDRDLWVLSEPDIAMAYCEVTDFTSMDLYWMSEVSTTAEF
jgi:hypothetical protein